MQETLLVHKDLNKSEGLDDLLVELEKEGQNSKSFICLVTGGQKCEVYTVVKLNSYNTGFLL